MKIFSCEKFSCTRVRRAYTLAPEFSRVSRKSGVYPRCKKNVQKMQKNAFFGEKTVIFGQFLTNFVQNFTFLKKTYCAQHPVFFAIKVRRPSGENPPIYTVLNAAFSAFLAPAGAPWWTPPHRRRQCVIFLQKKFAPPDAHKKIYKKIFL